MLLRTVDDGEFRDIRIEEGEMFLLPGTSHISNLISINNSQFESEYATQPCSLCRNSWTCDRTR